MIAKLFSFKGGVKPASHKDESATAPIRVAPLPSRLIIPLRQSARAMARCLVQPGQAVLKGEVIAAAEDYPQIDIVPDTIPEIHLDPPPAA